MPIAPEDRQQVASALQKKLGRELTPEEQRFLTLSLETLSTMPSRTEHLRTKAAELARSSKGLTDKSKKLVRQSKELEETIKKRAAKNGG